MVWSSCGGARWGRNALAAALTPEPLASTLTRRRVRRVDHPAAAGAPLLQHTCLRGLFAQCSRERACPIVSLAQDLCLALGQLDAVLGELGVGRLELARVRRRETEHQQDDDCIDHHARPPATTGARPASAVRHVDLALDQSIGWARRIAFCPLVVAPRWDKRECRAAGAMFFCSGRGRNSQRRKGAMRGAID